MFEKQPQRTSGPSTSSPGASPAKTSRVPAKGRALPGLDRASGSRCSGSSVKSTPASRSSKTSPPENDDGCPRCVGACTCLDTEPVPSRFLPPTSGRPTSGEGSSLLPTPSAQSYGSNRGGAAGRTGKVRHSLESLARHQWATPCRSDEKGPKGTPTKGGRNLPREAGGHLNPTWVEWLMGFPAGWTAACAETDSEPSVTPSSPSARKRSVG